MSFEFSDSEDYDFFLPALGNAMGFDVQDEQRTDLVDQTSNLVTGERCPSETHTVRVKASSLLEICAKYIGQNLPFEVVQLHSERIPEELQIKIAYWSFPLDEEHLLDYSKMMGVNDFTVSRVRRVFDKSSTKFKGVSYGRPWQLEEDSVERDCTDIITKVAQTGKQFFYMFS